MKHSKGPWKVEGYYIKDADSFPIAKITGNMKRYSAQAQERANARFIAASPDLLLACKLLVKSIQTGGSSGFREGIEAIAKAEGKGAID